jgi:hypothetical protein
MFETYLGACATLGPVTASLAEACKLKAGFNEIFCSFGRVSCVKIKDHQTGKNLQYIKQWSNFEVFCVGMFHIKLFLDMIESRACFLNKITD